VDHTTNAVAPPDAETVQVSDVFWERAQRGGLLQGSARPVRVVEILVLAQVPTGNGSEAFIDADDIAAVAAATLADPAAHAGAAYSLTGPEALTVAEAAALISEATGQAVTHLDVDREEWIAGLVAHGIPAVYGAVLRPLTETVASGNGSRPNGVAEQITGRPGRTFRDFARKNAAAWRTPAS